MSCSSTACGVSRNRSGAPSACVSHSDGRHALLPSAVRRTSWRYVAVTRPADALRRDLLELAQQRTEHLYAGSGQMDVRVQIRCVISSVDCEPDRTVDRFGFSSPSLAQTPMAPSRLGRAAPAPQLHSSARERGVMSLAALESPPARGSRLLAARHAQRPRHVVHADHKVAGDPSRASPLKVGECPEDLAVASSKGDR